MELNEYVRQLEERTRDEFAREYPNVTPPKFTTMQGPKFTRIVQMDVTSDGMVVGRSVWGFVDAAGNIYKADGWKRPAKGLRGNINNAPWLRVPRAR